MLDDFIDNKFSNYAKSLKKYFHAYLFEVDNLEKSYPLILAFAKTIICQNHYTNQQKCSDCNICHLIDEGYYNGLIVISPDGAFIKKNAIQDLQQQLSLKSTDNLNQVYIIKYADKLNAFSANSLLKFIEEPEEGIYGILITENRKQVLPTILSRCNIISLKTTDEVNYNQEEVEHLTAFIKTIHEKKEEALPEIKSMFLDYYDNREAILKAFNLLEKILDLQIQDLLEIKITLPLEIYDIIKASLKDIELRDLTFYLHNLVKFKNKLINITNININLFMDNFVIEMARYEVM